MIELLLAFFDSDSIFYFPKTIVYFFELRNSNGLVIDDTTLNVIYGEQRIDLNFDVPIGVDYQLGISGTNPGLYRNNDAANVNYPYDIGGLVSITGSNATSSYYYFFYDIEVEAICTGIISPVYGCTDSTACNYDPLANNDDGSC